MKTKFLKSIVLASLAGLCVTACDVYVRPPGGQVVVAAPGEVDVSGAPPPAPVDVQVGVAPGPDYVWIGGAWFWGGHGWEWQRGRWDRPPHPGAVWVAHHYENRNGRHVFVRGGWR